MKRLLGLALCLAALGGACVPPEPKVNLSRDYPEDTVMGEIQERGHIVIGVADDAHPLGYVDQNDQAQGFTAELGRKIADTLGVEARFITGTSDQLLELPQQEQADVTFPAVAMTEPLVKKYQFSDPYFVGHQRLLTPTTSDIETVADLADSRVCAISTQDDKTQVDLSAIDETIEVISAEAQQCLHFLEQQEVDAITGYDFLLAGLTAGREDELQVTGDQLATVGLGAILEKGAAAWTDYVNGILFLAEQDGLWETAYEENFTPALQPVEPPTITGEEAAALYPTDA